MSEGKFEWEDNLAAELLAFRDNYSRGFPKELIVKEFKQSKTQQPIPLFTNASGENVFDGDEVIHLINDYSIVSTFANKDHLYMFGDFSKTFSTLKAAQEYKSQNKEVKISLKEILSCCHDDSAGGGCLYLNEEKLIELVKSKL